MSADEILAQPFGTLCELIAEHARTRASHTALIEADRYVNYAELSSRMDRVAAALQREGIQAGEAVAICASASVEYATVFLGILKAGAIVVPLAPSSTADSLGLMLEDCGTTLLFLDAEVEAKLSAFAAMPRIQCVALDAKGTSPAFDSWLAQKDAKLVAVRIDPDQGFNIIYSSGTTGAPKGIVQPHRMRWGQLTTDAYTSQAVTLISTPLYSNTTLVSFLPTLSKGGTVILMRKFDVTQFLELSQRHRVTHAMLVPVQYRRLMQHPGFETYDLSSYQMKFATSAPFSADLKEAILRRWPGGLTEYYGMTEGGGSCILLAHEFPNKLHTVGHPMPDHDIRLIDENEHEVVQGEIGEIVGRSAAMMLGYYNNPQKTRESEWYSPQGLRYIRTGDVGRFDEDGFLTLLDRKKDLIISGGFNVYPSDLEAQLLKYEGILEAAVVGVPSERWGESPVAFVTLKPDHHVERAALLDWTNCRLSKVQRLADIQIIDTMPRSPIGKVLKREMRSSYRGIRMPPEEAVRVTGESTIKSSTHDNEAH